MFVLQLLILLQTATLLAYAAFSGFYVPDTQSGAHDYSGAWLVSRERFTRMQNLFPGIHNVQALTFAAIRQRCQYCVTLTTRDYFDFMVEHLSSAGNNIPSQASAIFLEEAMRVTATADAYRNLAEEPRPAHTIDVRQNYTLGILIFSSTPYINGKNSKFQNMIRKPYFEATFWSVYRHFPHIAVFVANEGDRKIVEEMGLPVWQLIQLEVPVVNDKAPLLPKLAVQHLIELGKQDFNILYTFEYFYYTEGDQVLHFRQAKEVFDAIDNNLGLTAVVPHRMLSLPLAQDLPASLHSHYPPVHPLHIPNATVVVHDIARAVGSCCDDGVYEVSACGRGQWWYKCAEWGLRNMSPWLKFGDSGLPMPPATEQQGACQYSAMRKLCPRPPTCKFRRPQRKAKGKGYDMDKICYAMPHIHEVGPFERRMVLNYTMVQTQQEAKLRVQAAKAAKKQGSKGSGKTPSSSTTASASNTVPAITKASSKSLQSQQQLQLKQQQQLQRQLQKQQEAAVAGSPAYTIEEELEKLLTSEYDLQQLLTDVVRLRKKIKTSRQLVKQDMKKQQEKALSTPTATGAVTATSAAPKAAGASSLSGGSTKTSGTSASPSTSTLSATKKRSSKKQSQKESKKTKAASARQLITSTAATSAPSSPTTLTSTHSTVEHAVAPTKSAPVASSSKAAAKQTAKSTGKSSDKSAPKVGSKAAAASAP